MSCISLRYADTLIKQRAEALVSCQEFLTWNDVQKCIDTVNIQVHEEHERKKVFEILHVVVCDLVNSAGWIVRQALF